jgi:hypothetical protein
MTGEDEGGGGTVREGLVYFVCLRAVYFRVEFAWLELGILVRAGGGS